MKKRHIFKTKYKIGDKVEFIKEEWIQKDKKNFRKLQRTVFIGQIYQIKFYRTEFGKIIIYDIRYSLNNDTEVYETYEHNIIKKVG